MIGAMGILLPKLDQLLKEQNQQPHLKKDIESIRGKLRSMHADACTLVSQAQQAQLDPHKKLWANNIRDVSYDIDDIVDDLLVRKDSEGTDDAKSGKTTRCKTIADSIKRIKVLIKDYKVGNLVANLAMTNAAEPMLCNNEKGSIDPRLLAFYKEPKDFVGIDGPRDELVKRLIGGDGHVSEKQLKIIFIYGEGGLGKTTLAKAVYDWLPAKFVLRAFVSVGRKPDVKKVLKDILFHINKNDCSRAIWDERKLIDELRDVLKEKRYVAHQISTRFSIVPTVFP